MTGSETGTDLDPAVLVRGMVDALRERGLNTAAEWIEHLLAEYDRRGTAETQALAVLARAQDQRAALVGEVAALDALTNLLAAQRDAVLAVADELDADAALMASSDPIEPEREAVGFNAGVSSGTSSAARRIRAAVGAPTTTPEDTDA